MTTPSPLLARLAALLDGVALNPGMVEASNGHRWREALAVMMEMAKEQETIIAYIAALREDNLELRLRLAALEAWREQTGEGK
jgi:hypothetical protein